MKTRQKLEFTVSKRFIHTIATCIVTTRIKTAAAETTVAADATTSIVGWNNTTTTIIIRTSVEGTATTPCTAVVSAGGANPRLLRFLLCLALLLSHWRGCVIHILDTRSLTLDIITSFFICRKGVVIEEVVFHSKRSRNANEGKRDGRFHIFENKLDSISKIKSFGIRILNVFRIWITLKLCSFGIFGKNVIIFRI